MAWRCRFLAARRDQRGRVIAIPDTLVDFHTDRHMFLRTASSTPSASVEPSFIIPWAPPAMFKFMAMVLLAFGG